jgi:hypothetical protein
LVWRESDRGKVIHRPPKVIHNLSTYSPQKTAQTIHSPNGKGHANSSQIYNWHQNIYSLTLKTVEKSATYNARTGSH